MVFQTYHVHCIVGQRIVQGAVYVSVAVQGAVYVSLAGCTVQGAGCSAGGGDSRLPRDPYIPTSPLSTPTHNRFKIVHAAASTAIGPTFPNLSALTDSAPLLGAPAETYLLSCPPQQVVTSLLVFYLDKC